MKQQRSQDMFLDIFLGELVRLICNSEDASKTHHALLQVRGYLLDSDDNYYYLGEGPLQVDVAVKKSVVNLVEIVVEKDPSLQALEEMPVPENEDEAN